MYAELSYFEGYHFQHIAAWLEHKRLLTVRNEVARLVPHIKWR